MNEKRIELDIPLLLPGVEDGEDRCIRELESTLLNRKGIYRAHVKTGEPPRLCIHFDPNLISLETVEQAARQAGGAFTERYRHERIPFTGLLQADAAEMLTQVLEEMPGMLHASVNYAAGLAFVAYESARLDRPAIEAQMRRLGCKPVPAGTKEPGEDAGHAHDHEHEDHDHDHGHGHGHDHGHSHGSAPTFLPHAVQERWTYILVALAGLFFLGGWLGETFFGLDANAALVFYLLSYLAGGYDIASHAIPGLFRRKFDTDVLMLAAALGAALLGKWAEGAFLLFLFSLGHAGEHYALDRARNAVNALAELMPKKARVRRGDRIIEEPVETLAIGDQVLVPPGDRMPVDGEVIEGRSAVDQSPITGESVPVEKQPGDEVFAGSINQEAALEVRVGRLTRDNTLNRIMEMVANAQGQQSPTQQLTRRFTRRFVPAILVFVLLVILVPPLAGWMSFEKSFYTAMLLLVASSPCALAIGTPAAILAGIAQAARNGVLIKGGVHLENMGTLKVMAFDKTGTLTEGAFRVTDTLPMSGTTGERLLQVAAAVEQQSSHPLARAVVASARERGLELPRAGALENVAGRGVISMVEGEPVLIGSI
ncbi:MAG TPA: heavy metal translocating P-type ATPase, partial [Sedimenticola sp.]|nr:heavy metal translocating P-type ATPase [Sedimenticola sp.]